MAESFTVEEPERLDPRAAQGISLLPIEPNLEGPFLTLEEFLDAQRIKENLRTKAKKRPKSVEAGRNANTATGTHTSFDLADEGTFLLTTTGNEELCEDTSTDEAPSGSQSRNSMASTAPGVGKRSTSVSRLRKQTGVATKSKGTQCRRRAERKTEDVDTVLRRYYFSLEWETGSLGPGLLAQANAAAPINLPPLGSDRQTVKPADAAHRPSQEVSTTPEIETSSGSAGHPQPIKKELSAARSLAARPPLAPSAAKRTSESRQRSQSPQPGGSETPSVEMRFYEVKLPPEESQLNLDYTVDYRRFSYTDFQIKTDSGGQSTIPPDVLTKWIDQAVPRNQDDAFPLFVLCRDLLRKFHQKEMRYTVKKEAQLEEEVRGLFASLEDAKAAHSHTVESALEEREAWQAEKAEMTATMDAMRARLRDFDDLERELSEMKAQFDPAVFEELQRLEQDLGLLTSEHNTLKGQHGALRTLQDVMHAREAIAKKAQERLGGDLAAAVEGREEAELRFQAERAKLAEKTKECDALLNKTPFEHLAGWNSQTKFGLLKTFLVSEELTQMVGFRDITMMPPRSQRDFSVMLLRSIKDSCKQSESSWVEAVSTALGTEPGGLYTYMLDAIQHEEPHHQRLIETLDVSKSASVWELTREAMAAAGVRLDDLSALELLSGVAQDELYERVTGIPKDQGELVGKNFVQFKKWFDRFGDNPSGLDDAAVEAMKETEKRRKYGLFEEQTLCGIPFSEEETLSYISHIFDHKVETDYRNEKDQKPRANMVKTVRSYMLKVFPRKRDADHHLDRFCTSVMKFKDSNVRVKTFGILAGLTDTNHWTERSVCFLFCFFQHLKAIASPGNESENPADLGSDWNIYRDWLGSRDFVVESEQVVEAAKAAADSKFGFGQLKDFVRALRGAATEREQEGFTDPLSFDLATAILMDQWFEQFDTAKAALRVLFENFDVDGDEVLELHEFIELVKSTPMKIRQHDAINMFHELAGPDDTMDQSEFAELLTFYKFNTRTLLTTMEATQRKLARRGSASAGFASDGHPGSPDSP